MSDLNLRAQVARYGPDPSQDFYQLDQKLLWDPNLKPLDKIVLIDCFHRSRRAELLPSIPERAVMFAVDEDTLRRSEGRLVDAGFLRCRHRKGKISVYLAAYPAPSDPTPMDATLDLLEAEADRQDQEKTPRKIPGPPPAKYGDHPPQNTGGPENGSLLGTCNKGNTTEGDARAHAHAHEGTGDDYDPQGLRKQALAVYTANAAILSPVCGVVLVGKDREAWIEGVGGCLAAGVEVTADLLHRGAGRAWQNFAAMRQREKRSVEGLVPMVVFLRALQEEIAASAPNPYDTPGMTAVEMPPSKAPKADQWWQWTYDLMTRNGPAGLEEARGKIIQALEYEDYPPEWRDRKLASVMELAWQRFEYIELGLDEGRHLSAARRPVRLDTWFEAELKFREKHANA